MTTHNLPFHSKAFKICSISECQRPAICRSWCSLHYYRWQHNGDPLIVKLNMGVGASPEERFWSRVDKAPGLGPNGDCWEWLAGRMENGYGRVYVNGRHYYTHRYVWKLLTGNDPTLDILHSCDNRGCCNPSHLREGTAKDNARDRHERGRSGAPGAKLTHNQIFDILALLESGMMQKDIAKNFNVATSAIQRINTGENWSRVTGRVKNK